MEAHLRPKRKGNQPGDPKLNHTVVYADQWVVTWNSEPPEDRPHPQLSVRPLKEVIDFNLRQMRAAVNVGEEPRQKWLVVALCESEEQARKFRRVLDALIAPPRPIENRQ